MAHLEKHRSKSEVADVEKDEHVLQPKNFGENFPSGYFPATAEEKTLNRALNRKLDLFLLPFMSLLYLFNGLDRGNVGNAETQGFTADIGAQPNDLNLAVSLFFITFVLFQPISAAVGRRVGPKIWIPIIMFIWGVLTLSNAFVKSRGALIAVRLLIGAFEAGFYPTSVFYLSTFYTRFDLALRIGLFYGQYAIAGAFSGAIAYGIFHIKGVLKTWQWLFIIEGLLTCVTAIVAFFWLPKSPDTAWFLSKEQRALAGSRIRIDAAQYVLVTYGADAEEKAAASLTRRDVIETAKDWKLWSVLFFNICASIPGQALSVFLPLVVNGLGYTSLDANFMSVPPYICGAIGLYLFALSSDHRKERGYHILAGLAVCLIGLVITVAVNTNLHARYFALCLLLFGTYVSAPLTAAWLSGNTPEPGMRSLVIGVNGFGNLSGVIGSQLFRANYAPRYLIPFYATLGFIVVSVLGYAGYRYALATVNRSKMKKIAGWTEAELEAERLGTERYSDKKYTFIYGL